MIKFGLLFISFYLIALATVQAKECGPCDLTHCSPAGFCPAGIVKDECNCCDICGLEEGHLCGLDMINHGSIWHGSCGVDMKCTKSKNADPSIVGFDKTCKCQTEGLVCGTDGKTYTHCQLNAAKAHNDGYLDVLLKGPCDTASQIIGMTESQTVNEGSVITVICQVYGYPLPKIDWLFEPSEETDSFRMPNTDEAVSVSERGGAEPMRINGYLQISNFNRQHEGTYTCVASNDIETSKAKTSLIFISKNNSSEL